MNSIRLEPDIQNGHDIKTLNGRFNNENMNTENTFNSKLSS